jgi:hypothetical protein
MLKARNPNLQAPKVLAAVAAVPSAVTGTSPAHLLSVFIIFFKFLRGKDIQNNQSRCYLFYSFVLFLIFARREPCF